MLRPSRALMRGQNAVGIDLALGPSEKRLPSWCSVSLGIGDAGVKRVSAETTAQRPLLRRKITSHFRAPSFEALAAPSRTRGYGRPGKWANALDSV